MNMKHAMNCMTWSFVICRLIGYRHPSACEFEEGAVGWVVKEEAGGDEQNNVGKTMMKTA